MAVKTDKLEQDEIIAVVWNDIESHAGWSTPAEIDNAKACECKTVGFFHHIKDGNLIVKHSVADNAEADHTLIPVGCILRIRLLAMNDQFKVNVKKVKGKYGAYVQKVKG